MGVNIKVLAEHLNLSVSTVSRAMRDSYEISESTKSRVREMALQLNYSPNPYASSLRKQNSKTIAVVIPEITNNFFSLAIKQIPTATAFAFWTAVTLILPKISEISIFNQRISWAEVFFMLLIMVGILGLKIYSVQPK